MVSSDLQTSATASLKLQEGVRYFTNIEATNAAGLKVLSSSDGVTIDSSPPTIGEIVFVKPTDDTTLVSNGNVTMQSSGRNFKAQWDKPVDVQSGIARLRYCAGKNQNSCDVVEWTELELEASSLLHNFETLLSAGTTIYVSLQMQNGAGLSVITRSNALLLDPSPTIQYNTITIQYNTTIQTPPSVGSVAVGNVPGIKYLQKDEGIEADWGGFKDQESGLDHYEWAVCNAVDIKECTTQFINVGLTSKLKNDEL